MEKPLINILTRTSNRPNYFHTCFESVKNQTYNNINHLISVDDDRTEEYVKKYTSNYIRVTKSERVKNNNNRRKFAPYNLYLNDLKSQVKNGWIMFLDDDDCFMSDNSLETIVNHIQNEDQMLLWQVKFPNKIIPEQNYINKKSITLNHISMIGFMYNKKYDDVYFDEYSGGDFYFIDKLRNKISDKVWINSVFTRIQRTNGMGGFGRKDDKKI